VYSSTEGSPVRVSRIAFIEARLLAGLRTAFFPEHSCDDLGAPNVNVTTMRTARLW